MTESAISTPGSGRLWVYVKNRWSEGNGMVDYFRKLKEDLERVTRGSGNVRSASKGLTGRAGQ